jgi:uncharacterized membrane protein
VTISVTGLICPNFARTTHDHDPRPKALNSGRNSEDRRADPADRRRGCRAASLASCRAAAQLLPHGAYHRRTVAITIYVVWWFINLVDAWVKPIIPQEYLPEHYLPFNIPGVGLIVGILGLMLVGALTANLFGRTLVSYSEMMLARMPIVRSVYRTLKQIFETVLSKNGGSFKRVGLIEFPRRGLYAIVFFAGEPPVEVEEKIGNGNQMMTVFMPNGPNPTTGFIVFVPASEVIPLDLSVEDAAKLVVSAGLVAPDQQERLRELAKRKPKPVPEEEPVV